MLGAENITKMVNAVDTPAAGRKALCYSVIAMASYDYRKARVARDKRGQEKIEQFFRSRYFDIFGRGKVNGNYIIDRLKKESIEEVYAILRVDRGILDGEICESE
jgi:hypothetical protein